MEISMLGADLNGSPKILVRAAVIDRNHVAALQIRCDFVHPVERGLIKTRLINRPLDEYKLVAIETYQFLRSVTDQAHRHGVQQFVGKMDDREWFRRLLPLNLIAKRLEPPALVLFQNWKWLEYPVAQRFGEFRQAVLHKLENIQRELPVVRALLDNDEIICLAEALPDFGELRGQQLPKERPHTHVRKIISFAADGAAA